MDKWLLPYAQTFLFHSTEPSLQPRQVFTNDDKTKSKEKHAKYEKYKWSFDHKTWSAHYYEYLRTKEDSIKTDLTETGCVGVSWINMVQNRVQWYTVTDFQVQ